MSPRSYQGESLTGEAVFASSYHADSANHLLAHFPPSSLVPHVLEVTLASKKREEKIHKGVRTDQNFKDIFSETKDRLGRVGWGCWCS